MGAAAKPPLAPHGGFGDGSPIMRRPSFQFFILFLDFFLIKLKKKVQGVFFFIFLWVEYTFTFFFFVVNIL
jgi:hypothetical protein